MNELKYVFFPLPLVAEIFKNPDTGINHMFGYGIYYSSMRQETDEDNAYIQVLFCYYRGGLTHSLNKQFKRLVKDEILIPDEYYNGFSYEKFIPDDNILELKDYCDGDEDLKQEIMEFHKLRQFIGLKDYNIEDAIKIHNSYPDFKGCPFVSVSVNMIFDFYKNPKTEYMRALFAMYLGIRSIIGNREYACTTRNVIMRRMFGAKDDEELQMMLSNENIQMAYKKYTTDYHYKKMIKDLLAFNFLSSEIGYCRRTYVSSKFSMHELEEIIIQSKKKSLSKKREEVSNERKLSIQNIKVRL